MIEPAGAAHAMALAAIHAAAFPAAEAWSVEMFAAQLGQPGVSGWIAAEGGMALVRVAADEAELLTLAVAPEARRRGIGRRLLQSCLAGAAGRGAGAMFLEVSVANQAARALYAEAGFAEVGARPRYYPDGADALTLRREIRRSEAA